MSTETGQVTGTKDKTYNLLWYTEQCLENALRLETYVQDAEREGDNELTGMHISDGDPTPRGLLGAKLPQPFHRGWRVFFTQQHGDNATWELLPRPTGDRDDD